MIITQLCMNQLVLYGLVYFFWSLKLFQMLKLLETSGCNITLCTKYTKTLNEQPETAAVWTKLFEGRLQLPKLQRPHIFFLNADIHFFNEMVTPE